MVGLGLGRKEEEEEEEEEEEGTDETAAIACAPDDMLERQLLRKALLGRGL